MKYGIQILIWMLLTTFYLAANELSIYSVSAQDKKAKLLGPDANLQLVVYNSDLQDMTREVVYTSAPDNLVSISDSGKVMPLGNGDVTITATNDKGLTGKLDLVVERFETPQPINFPNEIVPLFTKHGCNGGGCHGKSEGQNGFKLSLLGFEPTEDFEYLVKESRGRRLFPAAPEHSLLLRKGAGDLPHGGGARFEHDSWDYKAIVRWMEQGMPYGSPDDPILEKISVFPDSRIVDPGGKQQLAVTAYYSDGSVRDITGIATYESNQKEMGEVDQNGLVTMSTGETGDMAVMIRYQEQVSVFQATIPLGIPIESFPIAKNVIDEKVFAKLKTLGLPTSEICDDSTFLRRTSLDIAGRLPTLEETDKYLNSDNPNKRSEWIDSLLSTTDYAEFFANKWSSILRNKRKADTYTRGTQAFHEWIRQSFHINKPYNQFVSELVTARGEISHNPATAWFRNVTDQKERLQDTAQVLLGVRLQCAECHHHPYEKWSQQDYYGFSAFFSRIGKKKTDMPGEEAVFHNVGLATAKHPKTGQNIKPTPLGGDELDILAEDDPRDDLASWITDEKNPFFAPMLVNRYWKHFFNRAIVEPEDDMRVTNPPTNPELLQALSNQFISTGYDIKDLIRTICNSTTYQLSAIPNEHNAGDRQNYSRYYPKRLPAEVLLDSIDRMTGSPTSFAGQLPGTRAVALPDDSYNSSSYFLTVFGRPEMDSACECERAQGASLAQTLHLLNSKNIQDKLSGAGGNAQKLTSQKERVNEDKITELYKLAFSRNPKDDEMKTAIGYIKKKTEQIENDANKKEDSIKMAYEDLVWALLNTKEFLFNH
ncbi:MAG: S-layer protein [Verrucomicrobiaceae bacterium]|nr:S-layer protein [Verrucomicrobiaceae bacterium]